MEFIILLLSGIIGLLHLVIMGLEMFALRIGTVDKFAAVSGRYKIEGFAITQSVCRDCGTLWW